MKLIHFYLLSLFMFSTYTSATTVLASSFGYNSTNATNALQNAINSTNDTIIIDLQSNDWNVGPLNFFNLTNKTIIFEKGVKIRAIFGLYSASTSLNTCLFRFVNSNNITFIGYEAEFIMNKPEYIALNNSEDRHCMSFSDCSSITIKGLTLKDSGGDGIYLTGDQSFGQGYCDNVLIEDVKCINNYRQGLSIITAQNIFVKHCEFSETVGTLPEAGVDIEPNIPADRIVNVNFDNCLFANNGWVGIAVNLFQLRGSSLPTSVKITDCVFRTNNKPNSGYNDSEIYVSADDFDPVQGLVEFERCFIDGSNYSALYSRKTAAAYLTKFKDCAFQNVSQSQVDFNSPIFFEVPSYSVSSPKLGGYVFENVLISYPTNFPFFRVFGASTLQGLENISGNLTIIEPNNNQPLYTQVPVLTNVNFTFTNQTSVPAASLNLVPFSDTTIECNSSTASFDFIRNTTLANINYPLGISYTTSENATLGNDSHLLTNGIVIPSGTSIKTKLILARNDGVSESNENIQFTITPNNLYNIGSSNATNIILADCNLSINETKFTENFKVYPNPMNDSLNIISEIGLQDAVFNITNLQGQVVFTTKNNSGNRFEINVSEFSSGMYFLKIENEDYMTNSIKIMKN